MAQKILFFERHGVEEYYLYDTERRSLDGFLRGEFGLEPIPEIDGWVSPRLEIRFEISDDELRLFRPDGTPFLTYKEVVDIR